MPAIAGSSVESSSRGAARQRLDTVLLYCYILVYAELAWLIMFLLRSNSRH